MRNLRQYPVTDEEIIKLIEKLKIEASETLDQRPIGDMKLSILNKLSIRFQDLLTIEHEVNNSF
jgi:hypothetical protein